MQSKHICALHALALGLLVVLAPAVSLATLLYPKAAPGGFVASGACVLCLTVLGSWKIFGACPLTSWEKRLSRREVGWEFYGSWTKFYALKHWGCKVPSRFDVLFPLLLMAMPIAAGLWSWAVM